MSRDFDGEPTSQNHNRSGMKERPHHQPRSGRSRARRVYMGNRPTHVPKGSDE